MSRNFQRADLFEERAQATTRSGSGTDALTSDTPGRYVRRSRLIPVARTQTTTLLSTPLAATTLTLAGAALAAAGSEPGATTAQRDQTTQLVSQTPGGGIPNGPSTNAVISGDRRYARVIAFESEASDLVSSDTNGQKDVFAIKRAGSFGNNGSPWRGGNPILLSRGRGGRPANGPSFSPDVDGNFDHPGRCVAFLSQASNLVRGDSNGRTDAFLSRGPGGSLRRVSLSGRGRQLRADSTAVSVAGDCSAVAFVAGAKLYIRRGSRTRRVRHPGAAEDPSFAQGREDRDLVFAASGSVYLLRNGRGRPRRVARGSNPAYNGIKRQVVAYEQRRGQNTQIVARDLGKREFVVSARDGDEGDASSRNPVVVNSGFYVAFESDASNLGTDASGRRADGNGQADVYLYTDVRKLTLAQSRGTDDDILPGGGQRPSPSFYANYIVFDSPAPLGGTDGQPQIFMRYLGAV
jgi:hypothetical protein